MPHTKIGCLTPSLPSSVGRQTVLLAPAIRSMVTVKGPSMSTVVTGGRVPVAPLPPAPPVAPAPVPAAPATPPVPPLPTEPA